jgi:hypothetical protein
MEKLMYEFQRQWRRQSFHISIERWPGLDVEKLYHNPKLRREENIFPCKILVYFVVWEIQ